MLNTKMYDFPGLKETGKTQNVKKKKKNLVTFLISIFLSPLKEHSLFHSFL